MTAAPASVDPLGALLDAAAEGDDVAVAGLVRSTRSDVWRLCVALGSRGGAGDLVQATYLRALGSPGRYRGDAPLRAWWPDIARNVCADHLRRRDRRRRLLQRLGPLASDTITPPHEQINDLLDGPDDRREAFVLTQLLGLSYDEAAVALSCPIGTIRLRVARACADLLEVVRQADAR